MFSFSSEDRIRNGVKRILKSKQGATQGRLDSFFKPISTPLKDKKRKVHQATEFVTGHSIQLYGHTF